MILGVVCQCNDKCFKEIEVAESNLAFDIVLTCEPTKDYDGETYTPKYTFEITENYEGDRFHVAVMDNVIEKDCVESMGCDTAEEVFALVRLYYTEWPVKEIT